jgi:cytochrome c biogenesis protein CcmG/thiol:disulfide interchange protein DsbE
MLNINIQDSKTDVLNYVSEYGVSPAVLLDQSGKTARTWGVTGVPETFFVDPNGLVRLHIVGSTTSDTLERSFEELLQAPSSKVP